MPKIFINGAEYYYELQGNGDPLILIAGYSCNHLVWIPVIESLRQFFNVLVFDNRACGQTTDNGEKLSAHLMADDAMALANALGLKHPHIVGQSMGGTIAQCIASRYGNQIGKLVIMNSSSKWRLPTLFALESILNMQRQGIGLSTIFQTILALLFGEAFLQDEMNIQAFKKFLLDNPFPHTLSDQERQFDVLKHFDGREKLSKIKVPTYIIHGKYDILSLPQEAEYLASHIPNAKISFHDCGHGCTPEIPIQVASRLIDFLKKPN